VKGDAILGTIRAEDSEDIAFAETLPIQAGGCASQSVFELTIGQTAAGRPINQEVAYQAAGLTGDELPLISSLRAAQFLRSGGSNFGIELYHDRIRETLHARLEPANVKQIHRRLAQTLEARGIDDPESLFEHYLGADERVRAAGHAAAAAKKAAAALAFDRAAVFYRRALELAPMRGAEAIELKAAYAESLVNAGRPAQAAQAFLELSNDTSASRSLDFKRRAAEQLLMGGHVKEGLELFNSVLSAAGFKLAAGPKRALLSLLWRRLLIRLRGLNFVERDASQIPEVELFRIDACSAIAAGLGAVDLIRAADFQGRHLLLALRAGEPYRVSRAMAFEAAQTASPGAKAQQRALKIAQRAEALAKQTGDPNAIGLSLWAAGVSAYCNGQWKKAEFSNARGLFGRTLGLIGLGQIGREMIPRAKGFGLPLIAWSRGLTPENAKALGVEYKASPLEVAAAADIVSVHVALNAGTRGLIDGAFFDAMRPGAYFINTSRGATYNESDLARALRERKIAGAGIDVFLEEPPPTDHALMAFDNVILTPHNAGSTREAHENVAIYASDQWIDIFDGKVPPRLINKAAWPKYSERFQKILGFKPEPLREE